ncbi:hemerythrin HHE cation binding domain-containing protein [Haloactinopolyspora alba]|uniref:Hemerythrin HHE cation binding domain-containing protein n=1 Tax=Haloactinopolyspora alba TaxID=648780 RepID=A0A2P8CY30_9ACTN|nr:hemerythrin domain-containing protein [Haloactinopolyspora alba]PSK89894.1 hemerythrin HHE cation binding domain-containing protein [Haloactinopolyspora alba]
MADEARTVNDIIIEDHREVENLFQQIENTEDPDRIRKLADTAIMELVRHSVAEEQYLYPALREHLSDGGSIADHEIAEHAEAEQVMKDLEGTDGSDPDFQSKLNSLMNDVRHHVQDEERDALPRLAAACPHDQLVELGIRVQQAKESAPTRPHPGAPDEPPMNKFLDPGIGLVDRVRDALTDRPA